MTMLCALSDVDRAASKMTLGVSIADARAPARRLDDTEIYTKEDSTEMGATPLPGVDERQCISLLLICLRCRREHGLQETLIVCRSD